MSHGHRVGLGQAQAEALGAFGEAAQVAAAVQEIVDELAAEGLLGLILVNVNGPALGHAVTSLDPAEAPNATARREVEKINFALEAGNNTLTARPAPRGFAGTGWG